MGNTDQVWTPTVFTDATGAVTHEVSAASWGSARTVTVVDPTAPSPTLGFSSTIDAASAAGLVHMRARDYDPVTGQFLTPDPWVRPDGVPWVGVHAYTDGNPVSFWDPDGLRPKYPMRNAFNNMRGWIGSGASWLWRNSDKVVGAVAGCVAGGTVGARAGAFGGLATGVAAAPFSAGVSIPTFVTVGTGVGAAVGCGVGVGYSLLDESPPGAAGPFG